MSKFCNGCKIEKSLDNFGTRFDKNRDKTYYRPRCKECRKVDGNNYRKSKKISPSKTKKCTICETEKPQTSFYKVGTKCKDCTKAENKKHRIKKKNTVLTGNKKCKVCLKKKDINDFRINRGECRICEKICRYLDVNYRLRREQKLDIKKQLKDNNANTLRDWLEFNFDDNMDWNNYGEEWHIDHVIPISQFKITDAKKDREQIELCYNWKNLMPLSATRNLKKNNKIIPSHAFLQEKRLREFFKIKGMSNKVINDYIKKRKNFINLRHSQIAGKP